MSVLSRMVSFGGSDRWAWLLKPCSGHAASDVFAVYLSAVVVKTATRGPRRCCTRSRNLGFASSHGVDFVAAEMQRVWLWY